MSITYYIHGDTSEDHVISTYMLSDKTLADIDPNESNQIFENDLILMHEITVPANTVVKCEYVNMIKDYYESDKTWYPTTYEWQLKI